MLSIACTVSKSVDDTLVGITVDTVEDRITIQSDIHKLGKWSEINWMKFNKDKWTIS